MDLDLDWKKNLGNTDRFIRVIVGLILVGLTYEFAIPYWALYLAIIIALSQFIEAYFSY